MPASRAVAAMLDDAVFNYVQPADERGGTRPFRIPVTTFCASPAPWLTATPVNCITFNWLGHGPAPGKSRDLSIGKRFEK
jgi:hypothetical protein